MPDELQSQGEPRAREHSAKPGSMRRLRNWWWGGAEVEMGEEGPWRITVYPLGPGAKLAGLARYFRERWQEFVFLVVAGVAVVLILTLIGLN